MICDGEILSMQTYIENNCKQPHLYTLLSAWNQFISCALHEQCGNDEINCKVCLVTYKDTRTTEIVRSSSSSETTTDAPLTRISSTAMPPHLELEPTETTEHSTLITIVATDTTTGEIEATTPTLSLGSSETESTVTTSTTLTATLSSLSEPSIVYVAPINRTTLFHNTTTMLVTTTTTTSTTTSSTTEATTTLASTTEFRKHWPSEKPPSSNITKLDNAEDLKRQPKVEAQHQTNEVTTKLHPHPKPTSGAVTHRNLNLFRMFFAFLIFACNI